MEASEEISRRICEAIPSASRGLVQAVLNGAGDHQLLFVSGEGMFTKGGKPFWPDYLQLQIHSPTEALRLAQQLIAAATQALEAGGELPLPVTLSFAGKALLCE